MPTRAQRRDGRCPWSSRCVSLSMAWIPRAAILVTFLSCGTVNHNYTGGKCNFSSKVSEPERCFGGVGDRCNGVPVVAPVTLDYDACTAHGYTSVGSIRHDRCCVAVANVGYRCAYHDSELVECKEEWDHAVHDALCSAFGASRQWPVKHGPYPIDNAGDNTEAGILACAGTRMELKYQEYCREGCMAGTDGKVDVHRDVCGDYCICR